MFFKREINKLSYQNLRNFVFMFMPSLKKIQNLRKNPNHTIEKNKISENVKTKNSAFCLVWMVRSLPYLLSGLPCSVAFRWNEVSGICGLVDEEIIFLCQNR